MAAPGTLHVTTDRSRTSDFVAFCGIRNQAIETIREATKTHIGFLRTEGAEKALAAGDYVSVLKGILREAPTEPFRVEWLRAHVGLHAPLMFELGLAEFRANPTVETLNRVTEPLFAAGAMRAAQDAACIRDSSLGDAPTVLRMVYGQSLAALVKKLLGRELETLLPGGEAARTAARIAKIEEIAKAMEGGADVPAPTWIGYHGMNYTFAGRVETYPPEKWAERRAKVIAQALPRTA